MRIRMHFQKLFGTNASKRRQSKSAKGAQGRQRGRVLRVEPMEQRQMLASDLFALGSTSPAGNAIMDLYDIDPLNGSATFVASTGTVGLRGLAIDPTTGTMYSSYGSAINTNKAGIVTVDKTSGVVSDIGGTLHFVALDFDRSGQLYGATRPDDDPGGVYEIDKTTGDATRLAVVVSADIEDVYGVGIAFDGTDLLYKNWEGDTYRIDTTSGSVAYAGDVDFLYASHSMEIDLSDGSAVFAEFPQDDFDGDFGRATPGNFFTPSVVGKTGLSVRGLSFDGTAPSIIPAQLPPVNINDQPVQASAVFSDLDGISPGSHSCTVDYGDGEVAGVVSGNTCTGPFHEYDQPGVYDVTIEVTDQTGLSGSEGTFIVIYNPDGGFVTGGGWIDSPAGALTGASDVSGKATFGFVSSYKKGAEVPTGNTQFTFKAGDLSFHSRSYDFLVVNQNSSNAMFQGTGTINGVGDYKFKIWATETDSGPDTFHIRIWGDAGVIYDNGGEQALGGGQIQVHKAK